LSYKQAGLGQCPKVCDKGICAEPSNLRFIQFGNYDDRDRSALERGNLFATSQDAGSTGLIILSSYVKLHSLTATAVEEGAGEVERAFTRTTVAYLLLASGEALIADVTVGGPYSNHLIYRYFSPDLAFRVCFQPVLALFFGKCHSQI